MGVQAEAKSVACADDIYVVTHSIDDLRSSIGIAHDAAKRFPHLTQVRRPLVQEIQCCPRVVATSGDWLLDFVSQRGR